MTHRGFQLGLRRWVATSGWKALRIEGPRVYGSRVQGLGFRIRGLGFRVQGLGL